MSTLAPSHPPTAAGDAAASAFPPVEPNGHLSRRLARHFLLWLAIFAILQGVINLTLNPAGAFRESGMLLTSVRSTYAFQKLEALDRFLERTQGSEITIALGSSRMIVMPGPLAAEESPYFFNAAIDGGKAEDVLAFTRYILDQPEVRVRRVYINTDLRLLAEQSDYGERLTGVYALRSRIQNNQHVLERMSDTRSALVSGDWLVTLLERTFGRSPAVLPFDVTNGIAIESGYFARRIAARENGANLAEGGPEEQLQGTQLSIARLEDLEQAVGLWEANGTEVVLIFMPRAPSAWEARMAMPEVRELIDVVDERMWSLAESEAIAYCDFADPRSIDVASPSYWWDGGHYTAEAGRIIFDRANVCAAEQLGRPEAG